VHYRSLPLTDAALRIDADFLAQRNEECNRRTTLLSISNRSIQAALRDYTSTCMPWHCVLNSWLRGPVCGSIRLQSRSVQFYQRLVRLVNGEHREFACRRQCLLYTVHSHLKKLKSLEHLVRKTEGPLSQVMRRLSELQ
jgi:hypothetical protein